MIKACNSFLLELSKDCRKIYELTNLYFKKIFKNYILKIFGNFLARLFKHKHIDYICYVIIPSLHAITPSLHVRSVIVVIHNILGRWTVPYVPIFRALSCQFAKIPSKI